MKVLENRIYRHFKGNNYKVLCVAMHTETQEMMVVYQALYGDYKYFVRPYDMFVSKVDHDKYPDVKQKYRFELVEEQAQVQCHLVKNGQTVQIDTSRQSFYLLSRQKVQHSAESLDMQA